MPKDKYDFVRMTKQEVEEFNDVFNLIPELWNEIMEEVGPGPIYALCGINGEDLEEIPAKIRASMTLVRDMAGKYADHPDITTGPVELYSVEKVGRFIAMTEGNVTMYMSKPVRDVMINFLSKP